MTAIRKLNSKGERAVIYEPAGKGDLQVAVMAYFSVTQDGEVYALVYTANDMDRYVLVFKADGSHKTKIKLQPGFPWMPSSIAVFPNGTLLVTGQEYDFKANQPMLPFTGIFSAVGSYSKNWNWRTMPRFTRGPSRAIPESLPPPSLTAIELLVGAR